MNKLLIFVLFALILCCGYINKIGASEVTIITDKDSWVDSAAPEVHYGTSDLLYVWRWSDRHKRILIEMDLSPYMGQQTLNATLSLYCFEVVKNKGTVWANRVTSYWDEYNVTWDTQPSATGVGNVSQDSYATGWLSFDVTDMVNVWLDGTYVNYGFMLTGQPADNIELKYRSSEYSSYYAPKLVLEFEEVGEVVPEPLTIVLMILSLCGLSHLRNKSYK